MKREIYYLLITGLAFLGVLLGIYILESGAEADIIKRIIKIETEELTFHYQREDFWDEAKFVEIVKNKKKFKSNQIEEFKRNLRYNVNADNFEVEIDESKKSTHLECDIHNAISKTGNSYHSRFEWFLRPLGLDFLDDRFKKSGKQLSWEGSVKNIPITIILNFPAPIGNCHAHVWWRK